MKPTHQIVPTKRRTEKDRVSHRLDAMSVQGHSPTSRDGRVMSALPPKADMCSALTDVCYGPQAEVKRTYSPLQIFDTLGYAARETGGIFWFIRKRFAGSYFNLIAASRANFSAP
jgi:hypothetical protein